MPQLETKEDVLQFFEKNFSHCLGTVQLRLDNKQVREWLLKEGLRRIEATWDYFGSDDWESHWNPDVIIRDIFEELADAIVYEAIAQANQAHGNPRKVPSDETLEHYRELKTTWLRARQTS